MCTDVLSTHQYRFHLYITHMCTYRRPKADNKDRSTTYAHGCPLTDKRHDDRFICVTIRRFERVGIHSSTSEEYVCTYKYMCVCAHAYIITHTHTYLYIYIYICIYESIHIYVHAYIYIYMYLYGGRTAGNVRTPPQPPASGPGRPCGSMAFVGSWELQAREIEIAWSVRTFQGG